MASIADCPDPGQDGITRFSDYWLGWRLLGGHRPGTAPKIIAPDDSHDTFDRLVASRLLRLALSHSMGCRLGSIRSLITFAVWANYW